MHRDKANVKSSQDFFLIEIFKTLWFVFLFFQSRFGFFIYLFSHSFWLQVRQNYLLQYPWRKQKCVKCFLKIVSHCVTYWHSLNKIKMQRPLETFVSYKIMIFLKIVDRQHHNNRQKVRSYDVAVSAAQPKK